MYVWNVIFCNVRSAFQNIKAKLLFVIEVTHKPNLPQNGRSEFKRHVWIITMFIIFFIFNPLKMTCFFLLWLFIWGLKTIDGYIFSFHRMPLESTQITFFTANTQLLLIFITTCQVCYYICVFVSGHLSSTMTAFSCRVK